LNPNHRAAAVARKFNKPLIATSDAHRLHAFGGHFTSIPRPDELTCENVFAALRGGPLRLTSPPASLRDFVTAIYFIFMAHPFRRRRSAHHCTKIRSSKSETRNKEKTIVEIQNSTPKLDRPV
jgi:hypothetical protein